TRGQMTAARSCYKRPSTTISSPGVSHAFVWVGAGAIRAGVSHLAWHPASWVRSRYGFAERLKAQKSGSQGGVGMMAEVLRTADPEALKEALANVSTPDRVETPLGTFELFDGVPTASSTERLYSALDFLRGVEVFLNTVPGASLVAMRRGFRSIGLSR